MKNRSLWFCAAAAILVSFVLAGCGSTTYFAGRNLPPSGLTYRVLIAVQNPSAASSGELLFVDAFYDVRFSYNQKTPAFSITGYSGKLPVTIQNMPEEQIGAVYGSGDGSLQLINYQKENQLLAEKGLNGPSSSIFITRNEAYVFAANQQATVLTVIDPSGSYQLGLSGVNHVSVNPGGTVGLAFVQNSDYAYYTRKLTANETLSYSGGASTWPQGAIDCEPQNAPGWCLFQMQQPDGTPLTFDRPVKAMFSADGSTAYILNCGPECGGSASSISVVPVSAMLFQPGQHSGSLPTNAVLHRDCATNAPSANANACTLAVPGGSSNALLSNSTLYVVGQSLTPNPAPAGNPLFTGNLTLVNLAGTATSTIAAGNPISISDGAPGAPSRMILADDNTLWIGMTKCTNGVRYATQQAYGCLTMFNTSSNTVTLLEPYLGDLTGIAAVTGLHKVYVAQGGQVYIYHTTDGSSINNQYVTVTGTASDVAFMDAHTDGNNTVY